RAIVDYKCYLRCDSEIILIISKHRLIVRGVSRFAFIFCISALVWMLFFFFFSSRRRHTRSDRDWSSDVCSSDLSELSVERRAAQRASYLSGPTHRRRLPRSGHVRSRLGEVDADRVSRIV